MYERNASNPLLHPQELILICGRNTRLFEMLHRGLEPTSIGLTVRPLVGIPRER